MSSMSSLKSPSPERDKPFPLVNEDVIPPRKSLGFRFCTYLVLWSFFFQTLWPSVAFARVDVPLGAAWQDAASGLTFKIHPFKDPTTQRDCVRLQAHINPKEEWVEEVVAPPKAPVSVPPSVSSTPKSSPPPRPSSLPVVDLPASEPPNPSVDSRPALEEKLIRLLDCVVDIKKLNQGMQSVESASAFDLYKNLQITEQGIGWSYGGLSFVLDPSWNVFTTGGAEFDMAVKICTHGNVEVDNVFVKQLLAKGKNVTVRGTGGIGRLDAWATGEGSTPGLFRITKGSTQEMDQIYLHQGRGENDAHLTIKESLHQMEEFNNRATLTMGKDAVVKGGRVFTNSASMEGESYTVQSALVRNEGIGDTQAIMKASRSLTVSAQTLEQKGTLESPLVDLTGVDRIADSVSSIIKGNVLKTKLRHSWTPQGTVEANEWQDESGEDVFIQNRGKIITHRKASLSARFRTLSGGKSDLTGVNFKNSRDRHQTLVNEGEMILRKAEDLGGYHKDIENKAGATLMFLDCGSSSSYARDQDGVPQSGGLHLGAVKNAGTIGFGGGTYRTHGVFTNTATGVHEVLEGQDLWVQDLVNDGVMKAPHGYRINQRLGIFTKLGKVLVSGKLVTEISERAIRNKTGGTTWHHTGHIEADDWVDESDKTVNIENNGKIITRKSTTLSAQFETGKKGTSDLAGLTLAKPLQPNQAWGNKGKTILRNVKSLGEKRRLILNERSGNLAFLEGERSRIERDSRTGGLTMGDVTNKGTIAFGDGDYYTGVFTNHNIHEALAGQNLWVDDFINHGETHSENGYLVDMTQGSFSKLAKMVVTGGSTTIQFPQNVNAGQYLADNGFQDWELEDDLRVEAPYFHNTVDWLLTVPFFLWSDRFLNDATMHTRGFTLRSNTFAQGSLGGRLGTIKSSAGLDVEVENDVDNRRGIIESVKEGEVTSKSGDILVGQGVGGPYRIKNGSYIFSHKRLRMNARNIQLKFGEVGSKGRLELKFLEQLLLESATIRAMGQTILQGRSAVITRTSPYYNYNVTVCDWNFWDNQWRQGDGGDASKILLGGDLKLLVDEVFVTASDIAVVRNVTDKNGSILTKKRPGILVFNPMHYYQHADARKRDMSAHEVYDSRHSTFSASGEVDLNFATYQLANVLMSAAAAILHGDSFLLGSDTQQSSTGVVPYAGGRGSLLPFILAMAGGITQYRTPTQNPYVVYSTGSFDANIIDPSLMGLVQHPLMPRSIGDRPLRQLVDVEGLMGALQLFLIAATGKSYVFPRETGLKQLSLLIENGRRQKKVGHILTVADAEQADQPSLTWQQEWYGSELVDVPYLRVPANWLNKHLSQRSRGSIVTDEYIDINMASFLGVVGGNMAAEDGDIDLTSSGRMALGAAADTHQDGKNNHQEKVGGQFDVSKGKLNATAASDLDRQALTVKAKKGAEFKSGGKGVDAALALHSHHDDGAGTTTDRVHQANSVYRFSEGGLTEEFEGDLDTYAQDVEGEFATTTAARVREHAVHGTVHQRINKKEGGSFLGGSHEVKEENTSSTSRGAIFKLKKPRTITATQGDIILEGVNYQVPRLVLNAPNGAIQLLARKDMSQRMRSEKESSTMWMSMTQDASLDVVHTSCQFSDDCIIEANSQEGVLVEAVQGKAIEWLKRLELNGGELSQRDLLDMHLTQHFEAEGPTAACGLVVALAVSMCTMGAGAGVGMAVAGISNVATATATQLFVMGAVQATCVGLASSAAMGLLNNNGDVIKAARDVVKSSNLKSIAIAAVIQGVTMGMGKVLGTPGTGMAAGDQAKKMADAAAKASSLSAPTLAHQLEAGIRCHFQHQVVKAAASMAVNMGVGRNPGEVLKFGIKGCIAGVIGAVVANQLSAASDPQAADPLNPVIHKLLHGALGAGTGAIMDGERGARAGALGAFVAETVANIIEDDINVVTQRVQEKAEAEGIDPTDTDRLSCLVLDEVQSTINIARLSGAIAAMMADQDVAIAEMAAANAVENNNLRAKIAQILWNLITAGGKQTAKEAAKESAKQAGKEAIKVTRGGVGVTKHGVSRKIERGLNDSQLKLAG